VSRQSHPPPPQGRAKAVVGLPRDRKALRAVTSRRVGDLLIEYVDKALAGGVGEGGGYFETLGGVCIDYCITVERTDLLFNEIFSRFCGVGRGGSCLELLEPYILNDRLPRLNASVMQAFVSHYAARGLMRRVEQCVLHMDIASLDFHQVGGGGGWNMGGVIVNLLFFQILGRDDF
jgi:vacuolar protein sorting-associated protein 8